MYQVFSLADKWSTYSLLLGTLLASAAYIAASTGAVVLTSYVATAFSKPP